MVAVSRFHRLFLTASALMWCAATSAAEPGFQRLSDTDIRATLIDRKLTDDALWADRFLPGSVLDSHEFGEPSRGVWVIEHGELCLTRQAKQPVKECFEIWAKGDQVEYRRDGVSVAAGTIRDMPNRPK